MTFAATWQHADPSAAGQSIENPPPNGTHVAGLGDVRMFRSRAGAEFLALDWITADGQFMWSLVLGFDEQWKTNIAAAQVQAIGFDHTQIVSIDHLCETLKQVIGRYYTVLVGRTSNDRVNTDVQGPAQPPNLGAPQQTAQSQQQAQAQPQPVAQPQQQAPVPQQAEQAQPAAGQQQGFGAQAPGWPQQQAPANAIAGQDDIPF